MSTQTIEADTSQLSPLLPLEKDFDLTEIIHGVEVMSPSPFRKHQRIISNLSDIISPYIRKAKLGYVYISPLDVIFEENLNRLQPDLLFIRKGNMRIAQDWIRGVPDMVCEVVSQGSYHKDTQVKLAIYEHYKVPEYWIVIPKLKTVDILTIEGEKYTLFSYAEGTGTVYSKIIDGLNIDIKDIFEEEI
ncbi:MAG: Uma2 family endonuclease [Candidatus Magnetoovum sp. WYHC-5]|nr:Uma2 family endonuclease [Candidatus Magnetoovum sp. WYHC-5]